MTKKETDFEQMVREHKSTVYTVCYMFSKDTDEVNDLFQEVLINLWKGFDGFRGESKVDTWIWRIALNTCISDDRKKKRRGERVPLEMAADLYADTDEDTKQIRQLYARINKLGIMDRALVLLWLENLSYEEIGAIAGISAKNVSVKLVRIKQQLMKMSDNQEC
ncbi:MAG: sigma-70 family RNA polymerase sigma factor [Bacteroidales bacterium]|nr:sigma-70 family RNA polymerase sigma factor [Bacteroidales bacterium]